MNAIDRSEALIEQAVELFDQADDIERTAREGGDVTVMGRIVRGEEALNVANRARFDLQLPLMASVAINFERIANALESGAVVSVAINAERIASALESGAGPNAVAGSLDAFSTIELAAELARRIREDSDG